MAKMWYPVVDYTACEECGACVKMCSHGVYDKAKAPVPVVVYSEGCVQGCHGCGTKCPQGAITYVGDDTGWIPPNAKKNGEECACEGGCDCG